MKKTKPSPSIQLSSSFNGNGTKKLDAILINRVYTSAELIENGLYTVELLKDERMIYSKGAYLGAQVLNHFLEHNHVNGRQYPTTIDYEPLIDFLGVDSKKMIKSIGYLLNQGVNALENGAVRIANIYDVYKESLKSVNAKPLKPLDSKQEEYLEPDNGEDLDDYTTGVLEDSWGIPQSFLRHMKQFPLLKGEEEVELARKIRSKENGWEEALQTGVESNLRLVLKISKGLYGWGNRRYDLMDIVQEGIIFLREAWFEFDPDHYLKVEADREKPYRFSTFACQTIKYKLMNLINASPSIIGLSRSGLTQKYRLNKSRRELVEELGREPSIEELSERTGLTRSHILDIQNTSRVRDLEDQIGENLRLKDTIQDYSSRVEDEILRDIYNKEFVKEALDVLTTKEADVLSRLAGLKTGEEESLEEIAKAYGKSKASIIKIKHSGLRRLRRTFAGKRRLWGHAEGDANNGKDGQSKIENLDTLVKKINIYLNLQTSSIERDFNTDEYLLASTVE